MTEKKGCLTSGTAKACRLHLETMSHTSLASVLNTPYVLVKNTILFLVSPGGKMLDLFYMYIHHDGSS